jgi:hypothetical protein
LVREEAVGALQKLTFRDKREDNIVKREKGGKALDAGEMERE